MIVLVTPCSTKSISYIKNFQVHVVFWSVLISFYQVAVNDLPSKLGTIVLNKLLSHFVLKFDFRERNKKKSQINKD